ncbi:insulinoma-associated protein 1-like [Crotalus tigris]|uniref:insulinoma-associated protein 1-like n=1 Tax=Crotalus tigris TaxID=88082 RepID=UPI00192F55FD|nr:insulinoma-associated protein 1-like [Crotalus tigris]
MARCFLVKRSHRPMPISYRTRCSCYPAAGLEGGNPCSSWFLHLFPPLISPAWLLPQNLLKPVPMVPQFGTPEGPSSPVPLHSPARAVSKERSLHLASPISAKSFPAPEPLLLGPGGNLKLWAVATAAITSGPLLAPQRSHGPSPGALKRSQGRKAKAARKLHFENKVSTLPVCRPRPSLFRRRLPREGVAVVAATIVAAASGIHRVPGALGAAAAENQKLLEPRNSPASVAPSTSDDRAPCVSTCPSTMSPLTACPRLARFRRPVWKRQRWTATAR